ncbi:hypothetical protein J4E05_23370 [Thalassospira sp. NFXS8]|uniref:hypothetical protein n=1 Tax=Thalassospira sp. NFXS8 TaxID=2819093 RepID=UPI0032DFCF1B
MNRIYSCYCALMCLLAGLWALLVFLSVYVLLRIGARWLLRPGHTLLKDHPTLLDEFIASRVAMALVAMLLGVLSLGIARDLPELVPLSRMIHIAALFSAACCALMTASGDIVAASRPHNEKGQQS